MKKTEMIETEAMNWIRFAAEELDEMFGPGTAKAIWANPETRDKMIEMAACVAHVIINEG